MTPDWSTAAVRVGLPLAAAMAGGVIGAVGGSRGRTATGLVVHFAAGAFLALVFLHLLPESGHHAGWLLALTAAAAGWALCALLSRRAGAVCPGCAAGHAHPDQLRFGLPLLAVVSVHSALDGLALVGAPGEAATGGLLVLAVVAHKVPEGMAVAAVCRASGSSAGRALALTAAVQASTLLGFAAGTLLRGVSAPALGLGMGVVAGSLLYLAALTLRGERKAPHPVLNLGTAAAGAVLVVLAQLLAPGQ